MPTAHIPVTDTCSTRTGGPEDDPLTQFQDWMLVILRQKALLRNASLVLGSSFSSPRTLFRVLSKDAFSQGTSSRQERFLFFAWSRSVWSNASSHGSSCRKQTDSSSRGTFRTVDPCLSFHPLKSERDSGSTRPILQSKAPFCPMKGSGLFPFVSKQGSIRST